MQDMAVKATQSFHEFWGSTCSLDCYLQVQSPHYEAAYHPYLYPQGDRSGLKRPNKTNQYQLHLQQT